MNRDFKDSNRGCSLHFPLTRVHTHTHTHTHSVHTWLQLLYCPVFCLDRDRVRRDRRGEGGREGGREALQREMWNDLVTCKTSLQAREEAKKFIWSDRVLALNYFKTGRGFWWEYALPPQQFEPL